MTLVSYDAMKKGLESIFGPKGLHAALSKQELKDQEFLQRIKVKKSWSQLEITR